MRTRKQKQPPPPPTPEQIAEREARNAAFDAGRRAAEALFRPQARVYTHSHRIWDLHKYTYEIPAFQRGYVWTPEQAIAMMRRLFLGMPLGQIMVWEQPYPKPPMLLDGQQRLVTLGATVLRDGEPVVGHTVYLDYSERTLDKVLTCEPGPTRLTLAQLDKIWDIPGFHDFDPGTIAFLGAVADRVGSTDVATTVIGGWLSPKVTYEQAAQIFRCYNSGGTPINESELPPEVTE